MKSSVVNFLQYVDDDDLPISRATWLAIHRKTWTPLDNRNSVKELDHQLKRLKTLIKEAVIVKSKVNLSRVISVEKQRFYEEVFPLVCSCYFGCDPTIAQSKAKPGRETVQVLFTMDVLYNNAGVRVATDLDVLEPSMLLIGNAAKTSPLYPCFKSLTNGYRRRKIRLMH